MADRGRLLPWSLRDKIKRLILGGQCDDCGGSGCAACDGAGLRNPQTHRAVARQLGISKRTVGKYAPKTFPQV